MAYLEAYGDKVVGGGSGGAGGGHVIVNASGTEMAQEEKLQFAGTLKTTDDSTNGKTVVSDAAEEVEWSTWNVMTEQERTAYAAGKKIDIINVPGADGSISADLMTKLWENPNTSQQLAGGDLTLLDDARNYDFMLVSVRRSTSNGQHDSYTIVGTEHLETLHDTIAVSTTAQITQNQRTIGVVSNTGKIAIGDAYTIISGDSRTKDNSVLIIKTIYGIKKSINLEFSALAPDVSTSANKCMLSDGVTSVGDILDKGFVEVVSDGVKTLSQIYDDLFALIDNSKVNEHTKFDGITTDGTHYISNIDTYSTTLYRFTAVGTSYPAWSTTSVSIVSSGSSSTECTISNGVISQAITSSVVPPAGIIYRVIY